MSEEAIGTVTHYFARPQVGVIKLSAGVQVGETLHFKGRTTDFQQQVTSLEIEHGRVESAGAGEEVAIQVLDRVRPGDHVYRVAAA